MFAKRKEVLLHYQVMAGEAGHVHICEILAGHCWGDTEVCGDLEGLKPGRCEIDTKNIQEPLDPRDTVVPSSFLGV